MWRKISEVGIAVCIGVAAGVAVHIIHKNTQRRILKDSISYLDKLLDMQRLINDEVDGEEDIIDEDDYTMYRLRHISDF